MSSKKSKIHHTKDPNSIKNILGRLNEKYPDIPYQELHEKAIRVYNGKIKEEDA